MVAMAASFWHGVQPRGLYHGMPAGFRSGDTEAGTTGASGVLGTSIGSSWGIREAAPLKRFRYSGGSLLSSMVEDIVEGWRVDVWMRVGRRGGVVGDGSVVGTLKRELT